MQKSTPEKGILIYGGSFNPIHIGHLRLAIEAREYLRAFLNKVDFVPTASHPQKDDSGLLPFSLRTELVRVALEGLADMSCNEIEHKRAGPSYTLDTLQEYCSSREKEDIYFLLGSGDFLLLPTWYRGLEILDYCNLVVAPRGNFSAGDFIAACKNFWPSATPDEARAKSLNFDGGLCLREEKGSAIFYLPIPHLELSSSRIRELWLAGLNIDFLVPFLDIEILKREKIQVRKSWQKKNSHVECST